MKSLKQNRYFKTWMIRILINKCKDMLQKKKLVTYTDQMPETPFHEEKYAAMEWIQALEMCIRDRHYMDVRQGRQKLQKHISSLVSMLSIQ